MKKLGKRLRKWYYIESGNGEHIVWYGRFTTVPILCFKVTIIYGLDFEIFTDLRLAEDFLKIQKRIYKIALTHSICR
jgi:hypothetical protein